MFKRGSDAFNQKVEQNNTIRPLRSFYLRKDSNGNYEPKAVMHLHRAEEAVTLDIHEIKISQPDGSAKFIQAICMNEFDKPCPCCMSGMNTATVAVYKIYDFTQYTSQRDNQTKQVGVQPMLAKKTQQNFISSLASADQNQLLGKVVNYHRSGNNGRDWNLGFAPNQPTDQDLMQFQEHMKSYTTEDIMAMFPITDSQTMENVLAMAQRGGAGTVNTSFNPNNGGSNNGGYNPQNTFNNGGGNNNMNFNANNGGNGGFNPNTNNGGGNNNANMNFNANGGGNNNGGNGNFNQGGNGNFNQGGQNNFQSNNQNNFQNNSQGNFQGNGQNNFQNNGQSNNYQTQNNGTGQYNNSVPDQSFDPSKGGSVAKEDPTLGGGQGNFMNEQPNFDADDIPF